MAEKRRVQGVPTFADAAQRVLEQKQGGWRGRWHAQNWLRSLERYAFPRIGERPISEVNSADVLEILTPIWHVKAETARAVRQRVRTVLEWAVAMELRADNPCDRVLPVLGPQNDIVQHMLALPHQDVAAASLASRVPLDVVSSPQNVLVPDVHGPADRGASVNSVNVSADYFDTLGVSLLQGRTFTAADTPESPRVAIVSEAMAGRFWPAGTAVGRRFRLSEWDGVEYQVVGVSADYEVNSPGEDPAAYLHLAGSQHPRTRVVLLARTEGDAATLSADIRRELRRMEPDVLFSLQGDTLRETAAVRLRPTRAAAALVIASGVVALLLGAIGLYGVVAYLVTRRSREFAIRAALGARSGALLRLVLATGGWVVAFGVGTGAVLGFVATSVVARMTPAGVALADPVVWTGALLLIVGVAAAAHVGPARRVLRLDLMQALHVD